MMDRLRSLMRTLGVTALLICALSLAGHGMSAARPSSAVAIRPWQWTAVQCRLQGLHELVASGHGDVSSVAACEDVPADAASEGDCRSPCQTAAHDGPSRARDAPAGLELVRAMARAERCDAAIGGNATSLGDVTSRGDSPAAETPQAVPTEQSQAVEPPQAEAAPSRPMDRIADRFPAAAEFMMARRVGADIVRNEVADSAIAAGADITPAARATGTVGSSAGTDLRLIAALLLALCTLPTLLFFMEIDRQAKRGPRARSAVGA